ncbi:hypothetical protein ACHAPO_006399 [Fusarium lateritium]
MMASTSASSKGSADICPLAIICQNGDIILAVGPKAKIQVTSDFLKHVSPVFQAMLDGPMREGEAFRNRPHNSPITISLPVDNALAMRRLLRILYGADDMDLDFEAVYDVLVLADKYDMTKRLKTFGFGWVRLDIDDDHPFDVDIRDYWEKLVIAHMLGDSMAFFQISCRVSQSTKALLDWALDLPDQLLGLKLAMAIDELRDDNSDEDYSMGLCLDCFKRAKNSFLDKQHGCALEDFHRCWWENQQ